MLYAQLNNKNICHTVSTVETDISVEDYSALGKRYNNDVWEEVMYIQTLDLRVNLVGGVTEGLPLPADYLAQNPNVLNLPAENYDPLPAVGQVYDPETDSFSEYIPEPQPESEAAQELTPIPTNAEIAENQLIIMAGMADIYEKMEEIQNG